jgi:hypothetical protein
MWVSRYMGIRGTVWHLKTFPNTASKKRRISTLRSTTLSQYKNDGWSFYPNLNSRKMYKKLQSRRHYGPNPDYRKKKY